MKSGAKCSNRPSTCCVRSWRAAGEAEGPTFRQSLEAENVASAHSWATPNASPAAIPERYEWLQSRPPQPNHSKSVSSTFFSLQYSADSSRRLVSHSFFKIRLVTARWVRHERVRQAQLGHRETDRSGSLADCHQFVFPEVLNGYDLPFCLGKATSRISGGGSPMGFSPAGSTMF